MIKQVIALSVLMALINSCSTNAVANKPTPTQEVAIQPHAVDSALERGKRIADRLEGECNYWHIVKMNLDGTASVRKSIYLDWGGERVVMLPRNSWEALSDSDQQALAKYLSKEEGVKKIIVGEIRESDAMPGRNTLSVDKTVWES